MNVLPLHGPFLAIRLVFVPKDTQLKDQVRMVDGGYTPSPAAAPADETIASLTMNATTRAGMERRSFWRMVILAPLSLHDRHRRPQYGAPDNRNSSENQADSADHLITDAFVVRVWATMLSAGC